MPHRAKRTFSTLPTINFGTDYTSANVSSTFQYSTGAPPGAGTLNLNITGSTAGVSPGYYPVNWWTYVIGYGPTLHAVSGPGGNGGLDSGQTLQFTPAQATFHIDSGFPYNPIGLFFHWLLNMTKAGGYPGCWSVMAKRKWQTVGINRSFAVVFSNF
jgi:hypothetical protein